jgi:hypothetical protein
VSGLEYASEFDSVFGSELPKASEKALPMVFEKEYE